MVWSRVTCTVGGKFTHSQSSCISSQMLISHIILFTQNASALWGHVNRSNVWHCGKAYEIPDFLFFIFFKFKENQQE